MKLKVWHLFLLSILGGTILGVSFPFTGGLFPLAFIGFVPFLIISYSLNQEKIKGRIWIRFLCNYLGFILFNAITSWWIYYASPSGTYMAILANSMLMTLPLGLTGFLTRQLGENKGLLSFLVLWLSFEHIHYYWDLSWPWLNIGHVLGTQPKLIQWYEYSGVAGGTFWILLVNIIVYMLLRNRFLKNETWKIQTPNFIFLGLALFFPVISSLFIYFRYEEKVDPVDIVIVQPNVEAHTEKFVIPVSQQLDKMYKVTEEHVTENTDLVVCPETAIPWGKNEAELETNTSILSVKNFIQTHYEVPWIIGADTYEVFKEKRSAASQPYGPYWAENYNTALLIQADLPIISYHKAKLVLGGEKLPFVESLPFLAEYSVELGGTSGLLGVGEEPKVLEAKGVGYAPLICYESVYGDYVTYFVRKGAEIICVITNDGWWRDTPGYKQHRMFSQIRAIENRRSVARSANTGISCFIDQRGEIISELGWNEYGALHETINRNKEFTVFTKYGSILGRIACYLAIAMLLYGLVTRLKKIGFIAEKFVRK
ncbi:MAG: apolipoprotein N-acyltransferase [Crocinitomicaceae bacterium]|nr:apolipoprotein N-acyltransferase [Crocinitomicaceae bacterium]